MFNFWRTRDLQQNAFNIANIIIQMPFYPQLFYRTSHDLMATLTIWDTTHHKVIHGMVWQVEATTSIEDQKDVTGNDLVCPA